MARDSISRVPVLVSACLLGECCRYDGGSRPSKALTRYSTSRPVVPVCPEQLGGLPTPRTAADINGGDGGDVLTGSQQVVDRDGLDQSLPFIRGAREALDLARRHSCTLAIFKERSPSCGVREIVRDRQAVPGRGVCTALLLREGLTVISDEDPDLDRILWERDEK
jgi:uncharacterized protein YbbK (DUF523 family)